jgi:hypothetical protein
MAGKSVLGRLDRSAFGLLELPRQPRMGEAGAVLKRSVE